MGYIHGHVHEKLNHIWRGMKQRCKNPNNRIYSYYGGRGIKVCKEWDESYMNFREWAYANGYFETDDRSACTLDRIDRDGDYCPENCRWVDMKAQSNNRRTNHPITYKGETHNLTEWSRILGIDEPTLSARLQRGWSIEKAFEAPLGTRKKHVIRKPYEYNGEVYSLPQLAEMFGIEHATLHWRITHGWDLETALNTETKKMGRKRNETNAKKGNA